MPRPSSSLLLGGLLFVTATPASAQDAEYGPWRALPKTFKKGLSAAVPRGPGSYMLFVGNKSIVHTPSADEPNADVVVWPVEVDAAVAWDENKTLLFSGTETYLVDHQDGSVVVRDLLTLGLPAEWTSVSAAANYDDGHWILFRGKESILYRLPTEKEDGYPVRGIEIADWIGDWKTGIDAALGLPDGRIALIRGKKFKLVDRAAGEVTESLPYAGKIERED
jgi:hypothetical protein